MISATLSSVVIELFSNYGAKVTSSVSTAMLIPIMTVISGSSGNAGSQASVTVIRGLSLGEFGSKDYRRII
jgi:magnesium transporter